MKINDSLNVNKDIKANGDIISLGEMVATDTLRAKEDVVASKDIKVDGSVYVNQDITVEGKLTTKGGLTFDGTNGLFYTPATASTKDDFHLGARPAFNITTCLPPQSEPGSNFYFPGNFVTYMPSGSNTQFPQINAALRIGIANWNGNALIDVSGVGSTGTGTNGLEINNYCKRNTSINCGWDLRPNSFIDGGRVFLGAEVEMQRSLKIGWDGLTTLDPNTAIEINQNTDNAKGVNVKTWNQGIKGFAIERADGKNTFVVYGNGKAYFGVQQINPSHAHANSPYQFDGKIACKELVVVDPTKWADFVFDKTYNLLSLNEVETFYLKNKHLPCVPSEAEVKENGINTAEMDALLLQKIEELTLYIVQQQKDIEELKKQIKK